jgi:hypothetical protein
MATIRLDSITREMNHGVEVNLDIRTSKGKIVVPFRFGDQGSAAANEKQAYQELKVWLQEAQQALEALGGQ